MSLHLNLSTGKFLYSSTLFKLSDALLLDVSSGEIVMSNLLVPRAGGEDLFKLASLDLNFAQYKSLTDRVSGNNLITFTRASTGTYVGSDGLIKIAVTNAPRFDHDPVTGESLGLLIEESRTNNVLYSEQVNLWSLSNGSVSSNFAESPIGDQTADKWIPNTTNNFHFPKLITTLSSTSSVTYSIYAKQAGYRYLLVNTIAGSSSGNAGPIVDLQDGVVVDNLTATYPTTVTDAGNGWWRIAFTYTGDGTNLIVDNNPLPTSTIAAYIGDGTSGVLLWGAQLEEGSSPTSYIPTTGSAVTRSPDIATIEGTNFSSWYNQSEGTVFVDVTGVDGFGYVIHNGSASQRLGYSPATGQPFVNTPTNVSFGTAPTVVTGGGLVSFAYKANDYGAYGNGTVLAGTSPTTVPVGLIELALGFRGSYQAINFLNGHISRLAYFPTRKTDQELIDLTT